MELTKDEDLSAYYRGSLIQKTIDLELRMEIVIGRFLSMNNQERTIDLIDIFDIARVDFSNKMTIIIYIVKKHFPEFIKQESKLTEDRSKFFDFLSFVMINRNILAHRRPDFDNNQYLKLKWAKTANNSIQKKIFNLDDQFIVEFKMKLNESYMILTELESCIIEWSKSSLSGTQT